jgi:hypothetical protein
MPPKLIEESNRLKKKLSNFIYKFPHQKLVAFFSSATDRHNKIFLIATIATITRQNLKFWNVTKIH